MQNLHICIVGSNLKDFCWYEGTDFEDALLHIQITFFEVTGSFAIKDSDFVYGVANQIDPLDSVHFVPPDFSF